MRVRAWIAATLVVLGVCGIGAPETTHAGSNRMLTGFGDLDAYQHQPASERLAAFAHTRQANGSVVRIFVHWAAVAPDRPPDAATARNPAWPMYHWGSLDAIIRDAVRTGLRPLISVYQAPGWAEPSDRPPLSERIPGGTWRPSPLAYRNFAEAIARRYSGSQPDPADATRSLPRVRYWQAWNEPNLYNFLNPQWTRRGGKRVPASATHYRRLVNGFYSGVKAARRSNLVITGGTAPYGDPVGGSRIYPAMWTRAFLCVKGRKRPRPAKCRYGPARFDALAHHPYPFGSPLTTAHNRDDVVIPDFDKLKGPLRVAIKSGRVYPRRAKQLWATELSWDTRPPDPDGIPAKRQARYLAGALYVLWRQGVDGVTWFNLRDEPRGRGYPYGLQSGIYFRRSSIAADKRKPSFYAFRFPFTAYRRAGRVELWGLAPRRGVRVRVEIRRGAKWRRFASVRTLRGGRVFIRRTQVGRGSVLRARAAGLKSRSWRVG